MVLEQAVDADVRQAVAGRERRDASVGQTVETGRRAGPQRSRVIAVEGEDGADASYIEAFGEAAVLEREQSGRGRANPDHAALILDDRLNEGIAGEAVGGSIGGELAVLEAADAALRTDPDRVVAIFDDRVDEVARQPVFGRERGERAVLPPRQAAAARADPQRAVLVLVQREEGVAAGRGRVPCVQRHEAGAVEANDAFPRREPQIAVARLDDRID